MLTFSIPPCLFIQTRSAKLLWFTVVCLGFIGAGTLIGKSYKEWQENPIATSITTHPIDDLDFPIVTICPPRDSNTALYHDLVKAGNGTLSDKDTKTLKEASYEIFMEQSHKEYLMSKMLPTSYMGNMDQVLEGFHSLPKPYKLNGFEIKMWNLNGTITSPWYKGEFVEEYYREDRDFHMVLELPDEVKEKIGSGSLHIELEIDTREESGWIEQMGITAFPYTYTLHRTEKNWTEAEAVCQKEGGHLVSVTSGDLNEELRGMAVKDDVSYIWVGGRWNESEEWSWSDNSVWEYTRLGKAWDEDNCIRMDTDEGSWDRRSCSSPYAFICQVEHMPLRGKKTLDFMYSKDQLTFSSFNLWYKYRAASQQLLDSWKNKRMTGFRLSWRIENENPPLIASISEVGRSIQTPRLGETFFNSADASSNLEFKAILTLPEDFQHKVGNESLVIELNIDMIQADEFYAFTNYKLYKRTKRTWPEADSWCKYEGGKLASIHSEWQQALAERAADGNWVWLGGWKRNQWQWDDNSTWGFTKWKSGRPDVYDHLQMTPGGQWFDYDSKDEIYFLCQGESVTLTENGSWSLELDKEQLKFFPFYVLFKSQAKGQRLLNSSSDKESKMTGFTLNWFLEDIDGNQLTENLPPRQEDWTRVTPKYKQPLLAEIIQLARHLREKQNMTSEQVLDKVMQGKMQNIDILQRSGMCFSDQIMEEHIDEAYLRLVSFGDEVDLEGPATDEDIMTGLKIFQAIVYCPSMDIKVFKFVDKLLSNESSRTIIRTIVNLFHSGSIKDVAKIIKMKEFYMVLASTLNLQYGNILLATSTKSQLQSVIDNDWPFFTNHTDLVKTCLLDSDCETIQNIVEKLGNVFF